MEPACLVSQQQARQVVCMRPNGEARQHDADADAGPTTTPRLRARHLGSEEEAHLYAQPFLGVRRPVNYSVQLRSLPSQMNVQ